MENMEIKTDQIDRELKKKKLAKLAETLKFYGKVTIAYSGGVDSTFLFAYACEVLGGKNVLPLIAKAPNFAPDEIEYAEKMVEKLHGHGLNAVEISGFPKEFYENSKDRCYYCKKYVFSSLMKISRLLTKDLRDPAKVPEAERFATYHVFCDGTNADDKNDFRPGRRAALELGVKSPLEEAGLTKAEIRDSLRERGIEIWNKPASACLASRIPYGTEITEDAMMTAYDLEKMLRDAGYTQVRARLHDSVVRLELPPDEIGKLAADRALGSALSARARAHGYPYVAIDILGYRMGSFNEA